MRARAALVASLLVALPGCLGSNRRPEERKPIAAPGSPSRSVPARFVYREIGNPPSAANTLRLTIGTDDRAELEHGTMQAQDPLAPDETKDLASLAGAVKWDSLPTEYPAFEGKGGPKNPLTYEVTNASIEPARTVTAHDGNDKEDEAFRKFRLRLREIAQRIEASR